MLHHNLGLIGVIDCQTGFKLSKYWVNLGSEMLQLGSDSAQRRSKMGRIGSDWGHKMSNWVQIEFILGQTCFT